jgi:protein SCO1
MISLAPPMPSIGGDFDLIDHDGHRVNRATYAGRFVLLFFGFTHCRVVCPRALARISTALERLGELTEQIQPLYVSVDPERDTPAVMKAFLGEHFPRFTGLTGEKHHVDAMKKHFRVFAEKADDPADPNGYAMPHTALTYMLDPAGDYLAHFPDTIEAQELAARIRTAIERGVRRTGKRAARASSAG